MNGLPGPVVFFSAGLAAGIVVTKRLHGDPNAGIWGKRIADTRLRNANIPVGGTIALLLSTILPERMAGDVRALGVGALVGAVGWGMVDPLPPVS